MKVVWISLMLAGILHMFYNNIVSGNINVDGLVILSWIVTMWYAMREEKKFKTRKISLFDNN